MIIIVILLIIIIAVVLSILEKNKIVQTETEPIKNSYELSKYEAKQYVMTQTELIFYRQLKQITDNLKLTIFPQVDMERVIKVTDNNNKDRNKIKSRSIDYVIVNNKNCKILSCIELDDYTHNREKVKESDNFRNELFKKVGIPLYRIKVNNNYNKEELENILKKDIKGE